MLKKLFISIIMSCSMMYASAVVVGGVQKNEELKNFNQIIDSNTGKGIPKAKVTAPALKFVTVTDDEGRFNLNAEINGPTILSVQKDGYKPFSMTIERNQETPLIIGIEKSVMQDIVIETDMIHLGDNNFSMKSANAYDFSTKAVGAFYSKDFFIPKIKTNENAFLIIGSIIGIDTLEAREAGQSGVLSTYSSPPEIYCNGNKICELRINGDNHKIQIPPALVKQNQNNTITIKAGKNLFQTAYIDYDDIEFTNISVEIK